MRTVNPLQAPENSSFSSLDLLNFLTGASDNLTVFSEELNRSPGLQIQLSTKDPAQYHKSLRSQRGTGRGLLLRNENSVVMLEWLMGCCQNWEECELGRH